jgi:hypothetical protein
MTISAKTLAAVNAYVELDTTTTDEANTLKEALNRAAEYPRDPEQIAVRVRETEDGVTVEYVDVGDGTNCTFEAIVDGGGFGIVPDWWDDAWTETYSEALGRWVTCDELIG